MTKNPKDPPIEGYEVNPYAPPEASLGETPYAFDSPGNLAEAEAVRRAHLSTEASIRSLGSLHLIGVFFGVLSLVSWILLVLGTNNAMGAPPNSGAAAITFFSNLIGVSLNLALGLGLRGLKTWARWLEVVMNILTLLYFIAIGAFFAVMGGGAAPGLGIGVGIFVVLSVIPFYIFYLLLSKKGAMVFTPEYRAVIEQTPHVKYTTSWILKGCLIVFVVIIVVGIVAALFGSRR